MSNSSAGRKKLSRKGVFLMAGVVLVIVALVIPAIGRLITAHWSIGIFGRDTLTGEWVGTIQARQGAEYGLYLELQFKGQESSYRSSSGYTGASSNLQGHATLCTPTGEQFDYEVIGDASILGDVEDLWLEYGDPSLSALNLRLSGDWGGSTLTLDATQNPFLPDGRFDPDRVLSSDDPDDEFATIVLAKGDRDDLGPICARISQ